MTSTLGNTLPFETFYYERLLDKKETKNLLICFTASKIANRYWLKKSKKKLIIFPGIVIEPIYKFFKSFMFGKNFIAKQRRMFSTAHFNQIKKVDDLPLTRDINSVLLKNPTLINFDEAEKKIGEKFLLENNINQNDKIICIQFRSNNYRNEKNNHVRNSSGKNLHKTIYYFINKGFKVIRLGRNEVEPLDIDHENYLDYASNKFQSDFLDFYIMYRCSFVISGATGTMELANWMRKPVMIHNLFPLENIINFDDNFKKIILPKKIFNIKKKEFEKYNNNISLKIKNISNLESLKIEGYDLIENTEDEIYESSKEFYSTLKNETKSDFNQSSFFEELNNKYHNLMPKNLKICEHFIKENSNLFL